MTPQAGEVLLVGISVRMLAQLATRAGYTVRALDYFGDADLQALCPSRSLLRDYGGRYTAVALVDAADEMPTAAVVYGASLENHPAEVARLAQGRRLLGNSPATLGRVRDPLLLAEVLHANGHLCPTTHTSPPLRYDPSAQWLIKPRRSGGGHGVKRWRGGALPPDTLLQAFVAGMPCSASFVADGQRAVLLGITEQLIGRRTFGAPGFRYCGNLLPARIPPQHTTSLLAELRAIVALLTQAFGLVGINGVDFIWDGARPWVVEFNPRPSASLELIDAAYGVAVFDAHVRACNGELPAFDMEATLAHAPALGKAIIYAKQGVTVGTTAGWAAQGRRDVPHSRDQIARGHPVCTIIVDAATPLACLHELRVQARTLDEELYG
jgi:uncharacterized protein